jgi:hypothetical protein
MATLIFMKKGDFPGDFKKKKAREIGFYFPDFPDLRYTSVIRCLSRQQHHQNYPNKLLMPLNQFGLDI